MEDKYFWIEINEDGELSFKEFDKELLKMKLDEITADGELEPYNFIATDIKLHPDPNYWMSRFARISDKEVFSHVIIIKGKRIVPKTKEVTVKLEIE